MSERPFVPLRWYEMALLRFLSKSPRIRKLIIVQDDPNVPASDRAEVAYLERIYRET